MSSSLPTIGQCRACLARPRVLDARTGGCRECLRRYGMRFLALCIRARQDEVFRASVRAYLAPSSTKLFDALFGPALREVR